MELSAARVRVIAGVLLASALVVSACSQTKTLSKSEVETQAAAALTAQVGQQSPPITCPGDLEAKVGASEVCAITLDSGVYDVTISVTSFDETSNNATFDVQVATQPRP
jgi:hypothetical protein